MASKNCLQATISPMGILRPRSKLSNTFPLPARNVKADQEDFESLKEKYINTGKVYWIFHPDPADRLTLQAMVCLDKLTRGPETAFFRSHLKKFRG